MMAPGYYVFTGGERVPRHVTHVLIDNALKFVPARSFEYHPNIQEVICHDGVEKIEEEAFCECPRLRRVIIPGVKVLEEKAFFLCKALANIECGKMEIIGGAAFGICESLRNIDLPSIKVVEGYAFNACSNLISVKFGKDLETIGERTFRACGRSLERITIPLKDGMITDDRTFQGCDKLNRIDLVGGVHETVSALLMEEWKNDMNEEINSISQILPNTHGGTYCEAGGKAQAIRAWIRSVHCKYTHYKAEHQRYLNVTAATLQPALPNDIVLKSIFPFVELPSHSFDEED